MNSSENVKTTKKISEYIENLPNFIKTSFGVIVNIIVVIAILTIMRTFVFLPYTVDGVSMQPTLQSGEVIYVDRLIPSIAGYDYGDVIVFIPPNQHGQKKQVKETGLMCLFEKTKNIIFFQGRKNPCEVNATYVKRVIGLPGDKVEVKNGHVFVTKKGEENSLKIREDFLLPRNQNKTCVPAQKCSKLFVLASESGKSFQIVPEGKYFVLGDNRVNSSDSRASSWDTPFVNEEEIIGIVRAVYLSPKPVQDQGSPLSNYWAAIKNIPKSFKDVRFIGDNDILSQE